MPMLGRFRELEDAELSPQQSALTEFMRTGVRGRVPTPFRIWMTNPELASRVERVANYVIREGSLSARESEMAVLILARHLGAAFITVAHRKRAAEVGVDAGTIARLCAGEAPETPGERDDVICRLTEALMSDGPVDEALYNSAVAVLGHEGIAELTVLLGFYCSCHFVLKTYQVPPAG